MLKVIEYTKELFKKLKDDWQTKPWRQFLYDLVYSYLVFLYSFDPRLLLCFILGVLTGISMPPINFPLFLPLVFASIIRITDFCDDTKEVFFVGFFFSFGFYLIGFYWIAFSIFTDLSLIWLFPFALLLIPCIYAALNSVFVFVLYYTLNQELSTIMKTILFACLWCGFEYLRSFVFLPLPWNLIGYSVSFSDSLMQVSSYIGVFGLSVFLMLFFCSCHLILLNGNNINYISYLKYVFSLLAILIILWIWGAVRLTSNTHEINEKIRVLLIQGNIKSKTKWDDEYQNNIFSTYVQNTLKYNQSNITHIIWPESAIPYTLSPEKPEIQDILKTLLYDKQVLISGVVRVEKEPKIKLFNSMLLLNNKGDIAFYDKTKLVPFGEYIPFKKVIPFVNKITNGSMDFSSGKGFKVLSVLDTPSFVPLLCFESGFSGQTPRVIQKYKFLKPEMIVNLTNDSWFFYTSGPFQHYQMSRFRAIEEGVPVIRAASTGISAIIDPYGQEISKIKLNKSGILENYLPKRLPYYTLFSIFGNIPALIVVGFVILLVLYENYSVSIIDTFKSIFDNF